MAKRINVRLFGVEMQLLHLRGAYLPSHDALLIADPHFGKDATFRHHAVPVPRGGTQATLDAVSEMLNETKAGRLVILGDMFHDRHSLSSDVVQSMNAFFAKHADVEFHLVRGNHDARVGPLPPHWAVKTIEPGQPCVEEGQPSGIVALGHSPDDFQVGTNLLFCGHVHPAIRFRSGAESLKFPCFWLTDRRLVFPSIGRFTGTHTIQPRNDDRVWIVTDSDIMERRRRVRS